MESKCHVHVKRLFCGGANGTESKLPSGKRLDCRQGASKSCYEVELNKAKLGSAISRMTEGTKTGQCNRANLITRDKFVADARQLVGPRAIRVVALSSVGALTRST